MNFCDTLIWVSTVVFSCGGMQVNTLWVAEELKMIDSKRWTFDRLLLLRFGFPRCWYMGIVRMRKGWWDGGKEGVGVRSRRRDLWRECLWVGCVGLWLRGLVDFWFGVVLTTVRMPVHGRTALSLWKKSKHSRNDDCCHWLGRGHQNISSFSQSLKVVDIP